MQYFQTTNNNLKKISSGIFLLFALSIIFYSCKQDSTSNSSNKVKLVKMKSQEKLTNYISHPKKDDKVCLADIEKAKNDVSNGKIVFCMPSGEGNYELRQEKYIRILCKKQNLVFEFEMISDAISGEGRQGCYGTYMDKVIEEKYGKNFKQSILEQADEILIKSDDTISSYSCDVKPKIIGISDESIKIKLDAKLKNQLKTDNLGYFPIVDVGFYIDKNGNPSGYYLESFNDNENKSNKKFEAQLLKIVIEELKKYKKCESGEIKNKKVMTKNIIKVFFIG